MLRSPFPNRDQNAKQKCRHRAASRPADYRGPRPQSSDAADTHNRSIRDTCGPVY